MNKHYVLFFLLFAPLFLTSCHSPKKGRLDSGGITQERILGAWTDGNSENATFYIRTDSVYYTDHFASYKYELRNDSIHIHYPGLDYAAKLSFLNDTMIFTSHSGISKFWKFSH